MMCKRILNPFSNRVVIDFSQVRKHIVNETWGRLSWAYRGDDISHQQRRLQAE